MIWTIARRQLLEYLVTWRFGLVLAFSTVLVVLATSLQVATFDDQVRDYEARQAESQQGLGKAKVYSEVRLGLGRRPPALAFLCAGQDRELSHYATTGILQPPIEALGIPVPDNPWGFLIPPGLYERPLFARENPLVLRLRRIDFVFAVSTFLSLLALLLSFDTISGERETGTLHMVIANALSRGALLFGKLVGGLACLALSVTVALVAALIVGLQYPRVHLGLADWVGVGVLWCTCILFLGGLFALGMAVSGRTARSSTALVILLLTWTVAVALVPSAAPYVASLMRQVPSDEEYTVQHAAEWKDLQQRFKALVSSKAPLPPEFGSGAFMATQRFSWDTPYALMVSYAPREIIEWYRDGTEEGNQFVLSSLDRELAHLRGATG